MYYDHHQQAPSSPADEDTKVGGLAAGGGGWRMITDSPVKALSLWRNAEHLFFNRRTAPRNRRDVTRDPSAHPIRSEKKTPLRLAAQKSRPYEPLALCVVRLLTFFKKWGV
jgi:hypothetical protein